MKLTFANTKKYAVIALFLIAAVLSVLLMGRVVINYDISDYLGDDTETKISLEIIESEFGSTGDVQVMIEDISPERASEVLLTLKTIPNVLSVSFDTESESYYKDGDALFVIVVDGDKYSDTALTVVEQIRDALDDVFADKVHYGGSVVDNASIRASIESEIPLILAISICFVIVIMLLTSKSWIEPFVLLLASGIAVLLNMGTNVFLGEISYITNAVAAILQLALSIDYSIVLLHAYRKYKESESDRSIAMSKAVRAVIRPVSASAMTTLAGLLALLFMSFKIGFDIGTVLMKGIVISAIASMTLLPAMLLCFDKLMGKTEKKELTLKGRAFCRLAFKGNRVILPIALVLIVATCILQLGNVYSFTDAKGAASTITESFGQNNTVIVVYPSDDGNNEKEKALIEKLSDFQVNGSPVIKGYTAYSNTVREPYDLPLAVRKLSLAEGDVKMLFTMYHLAKAPSRVTMTPLAFTEYTASLIASGDSDVAGFVSADLSSALNMMNAAYTLMNGSYTAEQFSVLSNFGASSESGISLFALRQMYGLLLYPTVTDKTVDFETMLDFTIAAAADPALSGLLTTDVVTSLSTLSAGIKQFEAQMTKPMTATELQGYLYQSYGVAIDAQTAAGIFAGYYYALGQSAQETIPFLDLMSFLSESGVITDPAASALLSSYRALYAKINASYAYDAFLPTLAEVATALSGTTPTINVSSEAIQQLYILRFYADGRLSADAEIPGRSFVTFVKEAALVSPFIASQITPESAARLADLTVVDAFLSDTTAYDFLTMTEKLGAMQRALTSITATSSLSADLLSGIYIKYAISADLALTDAIEAKDLLDFITANMDTNELLKARISQENRAKIAEASAMMASATALFVSDNYSRMLLSVDLPSEGKDASAFVDYLLGAVDEVFGDRAHIAGEMVSTCDLENAFSADNTFITIFTVISIFLIVLLIFRSLSLPIVLVAIIQGAIWIAMSTSLLGDPMFFMSYIVATCILMGATIDYGILLSNSYVQSRFTLDKKEALYHALETAMPTVFTSGLTLIICGFMIGLIASQNAIATVGILLGKGTLVSVLMITLVLPSVLYLLDGFILKLTLRKKTK